MNGRCRKSPLSLKRMLCKLSHSFLRVNEAGSFGTKRWMFALFQLWNEEWIIQLMFLQEHHSELTILGLPVHFQDRTKRLKTEVCFDQCSIQSRLTSTVYDVLTACYSDVICALVNV